MKILVLVAGYLPGYKSGGPVRTIENMVVAFKDEINFFVACKDRDLGDENTYENILIDNWNYINGNNIYYMSPGGQSFRNFYKIINSNDFDLIYVNSFFDYRFSIKIIIMRYFCNFKNKILLAPRGEFSPGALSLKIFKKKLFINFAKLFWLYKHVYFHASSEVERDDIRKNIGNVNVFVAMDLPRSNISLSNKVSNINLKVIFISRISRIKNLDFALNVLKGVTAEICFDIYGPIEDEVYWMECLKIVENLPLNVQVKYCGVVDSENVINTMGNYDLFFFPTRGENYGHVISEAFMASVPVLVSDQTPWKNLESKGVGWNVPLSEEKIYVNIINEYASKDAKERKLKKEIIEEKLDDLLNFDNILSQNRAMFHNILKKGV